MVEAVGKGMFLDGWELARVQTVSFRLGTWTISERSPPGLCGAPWPQPLDLGSLWTNSSL
jgi:hypothetical protein